MNKKILFIFLIIGIFAISHVSAEDNLTDLQTTNSDEIADLSLNDKDNILTTTVHKLDSSNATFSDVESTIQSAEEGDTIELTGSFTFSKMINIDKSIYIVGTGDGVNLKHEIAAVKFGYFNITSQASNVVLKNLKFEKSNNGLGGAVLCNGNYTNITDCEFYGNYAQNDALGGALALLGNNCNVVNCTFTSNYAQKQGGAIYIAGKNNLIYNCIFDENYVSNSDNVITYGGAIYSTGESLTIDYCIFNGNYVREGYGGAVAVTAKDNRISNCNFSKNYLSNSPANESIKMGGAVYSTGESLIIEMCNFTANNAKNAYGGAISLGKNNYVMGSYFNDNYALLGHDIYSDEMAVVKSNDFYIEYNETKKDSIYGDNLVESENNFISKKIESTIDFIKTGLVFEYGASGTISVKVVGGTISLNNIAVLNHREAKITLKNNVITVSNLAVGTYTLLVTTTPDEDHYAINKTLSITVNKATAVINANSLTVALKSGSFWKIRIVDSRNGKPIANMKITLKVFTGNKYKTVYLTTNSNGEASYKTNKLSKGTHKVEVSATHEGYKFVSLKSSIKVIEPVALKFKLQSRVNDKDGSLLSYMVFNKKTKKGVNGIKIKVLIYTGKKYKTFILKTKKIKGKKATYNGAVGFSTNQFSVGKHKVKFMPASIKYKGSAISSIKIKKSATKTAKYFRTV